MKELKDYTDRELLEFIVSNQVRMEKHIYEITKILNESNPKLNSKYQIHLDEAYKKLIHDSRELNRQILDSKSSEKD